ncbi:RNA polymerase recycling motor HelD [Paenibacillus sp. GD4]|jgi:DNA helicase II / ATP-dependent DNA helicase PcrA|uniref:RNA polymerase recycling motor HelD n=1 Tax=Paenibacillus sp. GD4 TaxID=3068890 RepID=UPI00279664AE|nr:RNA polymerase recycling motor HelD [Paenibacillus sp. GD4]MDQ1910030.1 RNA polymerase recycling motor HelD [Paenibacillus sp. GD4]
MSRVSEQAWVEEQHRITAVRQEIKERAETLQEQISGIREDIVGFRKHFWDDVTVNVEGLEEMVETMASLKQQAEVISDRERAHRQQQAQLKKLKRLLQSPYFGRIDFQEDGEPRSEAIYVGVGSLLNQEGDQFLIYDWRAPVSSLYYDYPPGPAQYDTPGGTITGSMELKRQFIIRDNELRSLFDTSVTIGDELLQEVLGKQADPQMRSIVATIQKEQNRLIRNVGSRLLVVQGAAGSGKTSAALQRVAYLLYRFRETLRADQIVLFSPNSMFNSYVSTVLPELGEENMQQTTFQEYLEHRLGHEFNLEEPAAQMEYTLTSMHEPGYAARLEGIRFKASTDYLHALDAYVATLGRQGLPFQDIRFREDVLFSAQSLQKRFYELDQGLPIPNRLRLLRDALLKELIPIARAERLKPWVEDEIDLLDTEAYLKAYQELQRKKLPSEDTFDDFDREKHILATMLVREQMEPVRAEIKRLGFLDAPSAYRQFFTDPKVAAACVASSLPKQWADICSQTCEHLDQGYLAYEDATPYLYLRERLEGTQVNTGIRHVFVDEGQDYSPFQYHYLKGLFPRSKMTVLGDFNQAIYAHTSGGSSLEFLPELYGSEQTETMILTRTYRSTRQIVEFTKPLLPAGALIEPFHREGPKPTLTKAADPIDLVKGIGDRLRQLKSAGHPTIAVICKTAEESEEAHRALSRHLEGLALICKETTSYEAGVLVIPSYLAKGVEFDAVIVFDASAKQYGRESERKLFYTVCTRAMHELHLFYTGERTPLLGGVREELYTATPAQ